MKSGAIALIACFVIGLIFGIQSGGGTDTKYEVIHDMETITETETVEVVVVPEACSTDLVNITREINKAAARIDNSTTAQLDIMSRLRIAVATGDSNEANVIETDLRLIEGTITQASETLGEAQEAFEAASSACKEGSE